MGEYTIMNEVRLVKGLLNPSVYFYQLRESEILKGYFQKVMWLFLLSALIFGLNAGFGWGTVPLSKEITTLSPMDFEVHKFYFLLGRLLLGLLYAAIILFIPTLLFWTISEADFKKLVVMQGITLIILLIEKLTYLPLLTYLSLNWYSSPLSLGVISQSMTDNEWLHYFLGNISLFKLWIIYIQFVALKWLTGKKSGLILLWVSFIHMLLWCFTAFLAYIDFSILI